MWFSGCTDKYLRAFFLSFSLYLVVQISLLKQSLEMQLSQSQHSLQQLQAQFNQEREHLGQQLQELELEHQRREERLREAHCCAIHDLQEARQHDLKVSLIYNRHIYYHPVSLPATRSTERSL